MSDSVSVLSDEHVAKLLGISRRNARQLWRHHDFPGRKIGRRCVVDEVAFRSWLQRGQGQTED
jgi:hypothetical protein